MPYLTWVMSKFLGLGFLLEEVVTMATVNPARVINRRPKLGTLQQIDRARVLEVRIHLAGGRWIRTIGPAARMDWPPIMHLNSRLDALRAPRTVSSVESSADPETSGSVQKFARLSAGGRWIRTFGSRTRHQAVRPSRGRFPVIGSSPHWPGGTGISNVGP